jgi:uncharacterized protein YgbK (DUF1537 family)
MLCGSAGLAQALSDALPLVSAAPAPDLPEAYGGAVLAVAGSRHSSTVRQVEAARQDGILTLCPEEGLLGASYEMTTCRVVKTVAHQLSRGNDLVLTTAGLKVSGQGIQDVAERLGKITRGALVSVRTGGLILTGGDVAMAVCSALRCSALWLCGEVEPGIPWGRLLNGARPGLPVVTKAGGFGDQQALVRAIRYLHEVNDSTSLEELAGK